MRAIDLLALWLHVAVAPGAGGRLHARHADLYHRIVNARHRGDLVQLCNNLGLVGNAVEVGVWHAGFSHHNLQVWKGAKYYMVDAWTHRSNDTSTDKNAVDAKSHDVDFEIARNVTKQWLAAGRAVMMRRFSEAAVAEFPDEFFDFIYIDANHEFEAADRDMRMWWPKLAPGGMLAGDDFADEHDSYPSMAIHKRRKWGVKSAVARFSREMGSPFFLTFADHWHTASEVTPWSDEEFVERRPRGRLNTMAQRERNHEFYPAWYMFK